MKQKLGKISITPRSEWNAETTYEQLDLVYYNGSGWLAKKPGTGVTPAENDYWMQVTAKETKGEKGDPGVSPSATVTQTDTGATISITDASGTTTADIKNGSDAAVIAEYGLSVQDGKLCIHVERSE